MPGDHSYNEKELLLRIAEGDASIYSYLHDTYYNSLVFFSLNIIGNRQQAEDIAIESLVKIWQIPSVFESIGKLRGYLFTLVKNASLNYLKHLKVKEKTERYLSNIEVPDEPKFGALVVETDLMRLIYKEIEQLPQTYRQVVELLYFQGLPSAEVADRLGISMENLRQRKARAIKELKAGLIKKGISRLLLFLIFF